MSDHVSVIAFPDDRALGFNIKSDLDNTRFGRRQTGPLDPIEDAVAIRN
ncbi:hypothetical protein X766_33915 [Mesorhizobium sp. LSJC255A00]|nr:hypothetical protein X766_33915 [Mesorhizobium sp. LSJC255A00]